MTKARYVKLGKMLDKALSLLEKAISDFNDISLEETHTGKTKKKGRPKKRK